MVYRKADPLRPSNSSTMHIWSVYKIALKSWSLGPQTWRFPKYVSNKTNKKADDLCPGVPYPISGLFSLLYSIGKVEKILFHCPGQ